MIVAFLSLSALLAANVARTADEPGKKQTTVESYCTSQGIWQSLFDGKTVDDWQLVDQGPASWIDKVAFWRQLGPTGGWIVDADGHLFREASAGDLRSRQTFSDFYLTLEWKISIGGNSGIKLRVADEEGKPANTGFEMQILDDHVHKDGANPLTSSGALYGLYPSQHPEAAKPAGEWNRVGIIVQGNTVGFWLNSKETVSAVIGSADWQQRLAKSPQANRVSDRFARYPSGHILLQDHFDDVWFRDIKICELPASFDYKEQIRR